jgi:hypothetical protein
VASTALAKERNVQTAGFIAGSFFRLGSFGWLSAVWTEPGRIIVRLPPPSGQTGASEQVALPVRRDDDVRLQELAAELIGASRRGVGAAARGNYVFELQPPDGTRMRLVWSEADDIALLQQARSDLERVAHLAFYEASLALERGREEAPNDAEQACRTFAAGLEALGQRYAGPEVDDDTGMKLLLAEQRLKERNFAAAAVIYERILEARLSVYTQREKLPL